MSSQQLFYNTYLKENPSYLTFILQLKELLNKDDFLYKEKVRLLNHLIKIYCPIIKDNKKIIYTNDELNEIYKKIILEYSKIFKLDLPIQQYQLFYKMDDSANSSIYSNPLEIYTLKKLEIEKKARKIEEQKKILHGNVNSDEKKDETEDDMTDDMIDDMNDISDYNRIGQPEKKRVRRLGGFNKSNNYEIKYYKYKLKYLNENNKLY